MTTQPQHTPGPWRHGTGNISNTIEAQSGRKSHPKDSGWRTVALYQACCPSDLADEQEANAKANAALIVAAPETAAERDRLRATVAELVAALEAAAGELEAVGALDLLQDDGRSIGETIRAAIAKARAGS